MIKCNLKVLLAMKDMTQIRLAEEAEVREATLIAMNKGRLKQIPIETLNRICKVLDCNVGDILSYIPDEEEK